MSSKKIWQYPEATSITNDDYILMDSNTETGSQCLKANKIGAVHITKTVTERKVYKASDDNANGFSEVTVAVPYTDVHYDKDYIVSFVGEDLPLKSVTAYIEPQQDLHGYDAPWVGGSGKNKANPDLLLNGYTNPSNRKYDDTTMAKTQFVKTEGLSTITISATNGNRCYVCYYNNLPNVGDEALTNVTQVATSLPQTITVDSSYTYVAIQVCYNASGANVSNVQVESGSTATTFAPYSNICPISGWDEGNVTVADDITNKEYFDGLLNGTYGVVDLGSLTWYHSSQNRSTSNAIANIIKKPATQTSLANLLTSNGYMQVPSNTSLSTNGQFAISQSGEMIFYYDGVNEPKGYMVYELATPTTPTVTPSEINELYDEFGINGHTYTIPFTDAQGNPIEVYGGELDVVSGVLTVTHGYLNLNTADLQGTNQYASWYNCGVKNIVKSGINSNISNINNFGFSQYICANTTNGGDTLFIMNSYTGISLAEWKAMALDCQFVIPMNNPIEVQLTPTQVNSLLGVNNIWADCGPVAVEWQTLYVTPTT